MQSLGHTSTLVPGMLARRKGREHRSERRRDLDSKALAGVRRRPLACGVEGPYAKGIGGADPTPREITRCKRCGGRAKLQCMTEGERQQ